MGADRALHVEVTGSEYEGLLPLGVAKILAALVKKEEANLVVLGKQVLGVMDTSINRTQFSAPKDFIFVHITTPEMKTPRYSGHFKLSSLGSVYTFDYEVEGILSHAVTYPPLIMYIHVGYR